TAVSTSSRHFIHIFFLAHLVRSLFFFFNDPAPTEIYTLSLHDALPICRARRRPVDRAAHHGRERLGLVAELVEEEEVLRARRVRSEEHTSELQSLAYLVCRLLLEKKKKKK